MNMFARTSNKFVHLGVVCKVSMHAHAYRQDQVFKLTNLHTMRFPYFHLHSESLISPIWTARHDRTSCTATSDYAVTPPTYAASCRSPTSGPV